MKTQLSLENEYSPDPNQERIAVTDTGSWEAERLIIKAESGTFFLGTVIGRRVRFLRPHRNSKGKPFSVDVGAVWHGRITGIVLWFVRRLDKFIAS
jgi:hypothetical protein